MSQQPAHEALSRKEREKRARQQDILKAARELFAAKGFRDTTLDEIAQKAEFGKGTLYNYFASKEDIFHAIIDQAIENSIAMAHECVDSDGDVRTKLTRYAQASMLYIRDNGELLHAIFVELQGGRRSEASRLKDIVKRSREATDVVGDMLQREMDAGTIRQGNPADFVTMLEDMIRGLASRQIFLYGTSSSEEIERHASLIVSVLLDGITVRHSKG